MQSKTEKGRNIMNLKSSANQKKIWKKEVHCSFFGYLEQSSCESDEKIGSKEVERYYKEIVQQREDLPREYKERDCSQKEDCSTLQEEFTGRQYIDYQAVFIYTEVQE